MSSDPARMEDPFAQFESEVPSPPVNVEPIASTRADIPDIRPAALKVTEPAPAVASSHLSNIATEVSSLKKHNSISLDDVVARLTHVQWFEAVAIVDGVCAALLAGPNSAMRVPELSEIQITSKGSVTLGPPAPGAPSVEHLARMLHALSETTSIPVGMRLFITRWIGTQSQSIRQFAAELAFFARPDRASLIRAVYERCPGASAVERPRETQTPAKRLELVSRLRRWQELAARLREWKIPRGALPAFGTLGLIVLAVWLARGWTVVPYQSSASAVAGLVSNAASAVRDVAVGVGDRLSFTTAQASGSPDVQATAGSEAPAPKPVRGRSKVSAPSVAKGSALGQAAPPALASTIDTPSVLPEAVGLRDEERAFSASAPPPALTSAPSPDSDRFLYSNGDVEVEPPRIRYPQLPTPPLEGDAGVNTMELVISKQGTVERVKLISPPNQVLDMMLLHAAKSWVFDPASKQGQPVRYRLVVSWAVTP